MFYIIWAVPIFLWNLPLSLNEYFTNYFVGGPVHDEKMDPTGSKVLEK